MLTRDELIAKSAELMETEVVEIPEWGGAVKFRALTAGDRLHWLAHMKVAHMNADPAEFAERSLDLVMSCIVTADNALMFDRKNPEDRLIVMALGDVGFAKALQAAQKINNMIVRAPDAEEPEEEPEAVKNSETIP